MQERHFDIELRELNEKLILMAGNVERAIEDSIQALLEWSPAQLKNVHEIERRVNQLHLQIDDDCVKLLARHQPMAADLRLIVAILKINTDLERMGDQAVNIARNAERYLTAPPFKPLVDLPRMSEESRQMVRKALDAFTQRSVELADEVLVQDDVVDALKNKIFRDVLERVKIHPEEIEQGLNLILITRNIERIADHATNIAEELIFAVTGSDVRHSAKRNGTQAYERKVENPRR